MDIKPRGGRKPVMVMVDGEIVMIKKVTSFGSSDAIFIPKEWVIAQTILHGEAPVKYSIIYNAEVLTMRPYYGKAGG